MRLCIIFLLAFLSFSGSAQQLEIISKPLGGVHFYYADTVDLSPRQVLEVMRINEQAHNLFKKASVLNNVGGALGFVGGFMVGFPVGAALLGGKPEWLLAVGGCVLIGGSIAFEKVYRRKAASAISMYNNQVAQSFNIRTKFYFTGTGMRLVVKF